MIFGLIQSFGYFLLHFHECVHYFAHKVVLKIKWYLLRKI